MEIGERLKEFILKCYETQKDFAKIVDSKSTVISRYILGHAIPRGEQLFKFRKNAGLSIDWLFEGEGTMFAKNRIGLVLQKKFEQESVKDPDKPFDRIKIWVEENYGSIQTLAVTLNLNYEDIHNILYNDYVMDPDFLKALEKAGCNIDWLSTGTGSRFAQNPIGLILKVNNSKENIEDTNDFNTSGEYTSKEELLRMIREAVRAEIRNIKEVDDEK